MSTISPVAAPPRAVDRRSMHPVKLASLNDVSINVVATMKGGISFRPSSRFSIPVSLTNLSDRSLEWTDRNALNLAYRWLGEDGEMVERDGRRTFMPVDQLSPGNQLDLEMLGNTPDATGIYRLQISLLLEGIHWARDVAPTGWAEFVVHVVPAPAWPEALRHSRGGRALRGAMVAHELGRLLTKQSFDINPARARAESEIDVASQSAPIKVPKARPYDRLRDRLRAILGVSGLQNQLENVLATTNRQERLVRELESQLLLLRGDLGLDLDMPKVGAPEFEKDMAEARMRLNAFLGARKRASSPTPAASGKKAAGRFNRPEKSGAKSETLRK